MRYLLLLTAVFSFLSAMPQLPVDNAAREVVFIDVNVIPMDRNLVLSHQDVVVHNGLISDIGATGKVKYGNGALKIPSKGKYLMPGLAEMHAHVPPVNDIDPMKDVVKLFLLKGVTTIRGMLGHPRHLELRSLIKSGDVIGPRFLTSGPSFNGNSVKNTETAISMVKEQKRMGYDFLKLHPGLTKENFEAVAKAAKEAGITFAGHVSFDVGVWRAIQAGYSTIDHMDGFVESLLPGLENMKESDVGFVAMFAADKAQESIIPWLVDSLRKYQTWVVPTQALAERWFHPDRSTADLANEDEMKYMDPSTIQNWINAKNSLHQNPAYNPTTIRRLIDVRRKLIFQCERGGVGLLLGSDAPQIFDVPGFSVHHELKYLVDAGLSPYEALKSGTVNVGKFLNRNDLGIIKVGAVADLLLLNGNPLEDIQQSGNIEGVMAGKRWLDKEYIATGLKQLVKKK